MEFIRLNKIWQLLNILKAKAFVVDQFECSSKLKISGIDSNIAESILNDEITVYKGASILKNFLSIAGKETFFDGLKIFLNKFGNKNSNFNDLKDIYLDLLKKSPSELNPIMVIEPFIVKEGMNRLSLVFNL